MKNRKIGKFTAAGFVGLIVLVVLILLSNSLRRSSHIVLPDTIQPTEDSSTMESGAEGAITPIVVTPETVQAAIESLHRPANYRRSITVERLWSGGSGTSEITVSVSGGWTRTDATPSPTGRRPISGTGSKPEFTAVPLEKFQRMRSRAFLRMRMCWLCR